MFHSALLLRGTSAAATTTSAAAATTTTTTTTVPLLVDESYYKLSTAGSGGGGSDTHHANTTFDGSYISPNHIIDRHMKIVVKTHPKSMNAFVFIMNDTETAVLDFYITTENGITTATAAATAGSIDILTKTCKDDINSFLHHFKLCS